MIIEVNEFYLLLSITNKLLINYHTFLPLTIF
jgi:hypothetical protein